MMRLLLLVTLLGIALTASEKPPIDYPYAPYHQGRMDPQITGWPLSAEGRAWAMKPWEQRRPGHEVGEVQSWLIHCIPSAGKNPEPWLKLHGFLVDVVRTHKRPVDVVLLGDDITWMWGGTSIGSPDYQEPWVKRFGTLNTVNLGIRGDTTGNVLWRLDHGALDTILPRVVVLQIGANNNPNHENTEFMGYGPQHNMEWVGIGIQHVVANVLARLQLSKTKLILVAPVLNDSENMLRFSKFLHDLYPDPDPLGRSWEEIGVRPGNHSRVQMLHLWEDLILPDGSIDLELYVVGGDGHELYAERLEPLLKQALEVYE